MALDTISSSDLLDSLLIYESICGTSTCPLKHENGSSLFQDEDYPGFDEQRNVVAGEAEEAMAGLVPLPPPAPSLGAVQGRKKRRRRPKICKNKEEAETQRMTHIVVERNRRKQMNEHLAVLRSLMPESYAQRGDQASIVGGAIEYVKQLEHLLQTLEAKKLASAQGKVSEAPFPDFFTYPQYTWSLSPNNFNCKTAASVADIQVTLLQTHACLRILSNNRPRQLSKLLAGFQLLRLTVLHLNVTSLHPLVLYSISAKVEEGCQLTSLDDIAEATHHMLRIIEEEAATC